MRCHAALARRPAVTSRRVSASAVLAAVAGLVLGSLALTPSMEAEETWTWPPPSAGGSVVEGSPSFAMLSELYGDGSAVARERVGQGLASGVTFHSVLSSAERDFVVGSGVPFSYFSIPGEAALGSSCYPASSDAAAGSTLAELTRLVGPDVWRPGRA